MRMPAPKDLAALCWLSFVFVVPCHSRAEDLPDGVQTRQELKELKNQNRALQEQLQRQQVLIDSLAQKVASLESSDNHHHSGPMVDSNYEAAALPARASSGFAGSTFSNVRISAEGGVGYFHSGAGGPSPNGDFKVDEARLFIESPIWREVYFYGELNLATREQPDVVARLGEIYLDFENVSQLWNRERMLNLRLGRIYIPFGEEYQTRYAIDNPLISHSLSDIWGVDEGIELYGKLGPVQYALAVQNGGIPDTTDYTADKSVAGRLCYDPTRWLHLSASAMRTGNVDAQRDMLSALWFGNGFFRSLGGPGTTQFHADLAEGDITLRLPKGHLSAFGGWIGYGDNDPNGTNHRDVYYYSFEAVKDLAPRLYAAGRFSGAVAPEGFPIVANGDFGQFLFGSLTERIWRFSFGLGYQLNDNLILKAEYSLEQGRTTSGEGRNHENQFAAEAAFRF